MNVKVISRTVGYALLVSALFMFLSILVSVSRGNDSALTALLISFTITFAVGIFPFIFVRGGQPISLRDGYLIIVLSWLLSFVFGMLPYALWGGPFTLANAWFESVSGFTTTGSTILADVEVLPDSLLFWRSSTHFIGGLGVVVFLLLVIPNSSQMRLRMTHLEVSSLSKSGYKTRLNRTALVFTYVYFGIFVASFLCYILAGMRPFDALNHAMSVTATGGFSTRNASIGAFGSPVISILTMVFMFLSSIHFGMTYMAFATRSLKPFKNEVLRFYLAILLLGTTVVTLSLKFSDIEPAWGGALLSGSFHVLSYVSTTGFGIADNSAWPALPSMILLIGGIFCGMAGSTTGGIKSDRALLFFKQIGYNIKKALHPASIHEIRVNGRVVRQEDVTAHILYIALYFMAIVISLALCLIMSGDNGHAFMATLSSLSNVGPAVGDLGTFGNFSAEPVGAKIIYTLDMFLGRVEIYPVLAVLMMLSGRTSK